MTIISMMSRSSVAIVVVVVCKHSIVMGICGLVEGGLQRRAVLATASFAATTSVSSTVIAAVHRVEQSLVVQMMIVAERDRLHRVLV